MFVIMKERFVATHRDTVSEETEKRLHRSLIDQHLNMLYFYGNIRRSDFFCVHTIFADGVFFNPNV
jgi:hypothetical protein